MTFDDPVGRLESMAELTNQEREQVLSGTAASLFAGSPALGAAAR
jgi:hypothetical protein